MMDLGLRVRVLCLVIAAGGLTSTAHAECGESLSRQQVLGVAPNGWFVSYATSYLDEADGCGAETIVLHDAKGADLVTWKRGGDDACGAWEATGPKAAEFRTLSGGTDRKGAQLAAAVQQKVGATAKLTPTTTSVRVRHEESGTDHQTMWFVAGRATLLIKHEHSNGETLIGPARLFKSPSTPSLLFLRYNVRNDYCGKDISEDLVWVPASRLSPTDTSALLESCDDKTKLVERAECLFDASPETAWDRVAALVCAGDEHLADDPQPFAYALAGFADLKEEPLVAWTKHADARVRRLGVLALGQWLFALSAGALHGTAFDWDVRKARLDNVRTVCQAARDDRDELVRSAAKDCLEYVSAKAPSDDDALATFPRDCKYFDCNGAIVGVAEDGRFLFRHQDRASANYLEVHAANGQLLHRFRQACFVYDNGDPRENGSTWCVDGKPERWLTAIVDGNPSFEGATKRVMKHLGALTPLLPEAQRATIAKDNRIKVGEATLFIAPFEKGEAGSAQLMSHPKSSLLFLNVGGSVGAKKKKGWSNVIWLTRDHLKPGDLSADVSHCYEPRGGRGLPVVGDIARCLSTIASPIAIDEIAKLLASIDDDSGPWVWPDLGKAAVNVATEAKLGTARFATMTQAKEKNDVLLGYWALADSAAHSDAATQAKLAETCRAAATTEADAAITDGALHCMVAAHGIVDHARLLGLMLRSPCTDQLCNDVRTAALTLASERNLLTTDDLHTLVKLFGDNQNMSLWNEAVCTALQSRVKPTDSGTKNWAPAIPKNGTACVELRRALKLE